MSAGLATVEPVTDVSAVTRAPEQPLRTYESVRGYVERVCFKTGPPELVGAELEWIVVSPDRPCDPVPIDLLRRLLAAGGPLPHRSSLTFEPGGQLELSSPALSGPSACWRALHADAVHARSVLADAGLAVLPTALDPFRAPRRQLHEPRYDAMATYFETIGSELGPVMMNSTAAVQVNLDIGADRADALRRWRLLHAVGPVLVAAFANSPVHAGADTGWKSGRQRVWQRLDPARTSAPVGEDPVAAWTDYALGAPLMLGPRADGAGTAPGPVRTFRDWLGDEDGPRHDDLDLHLTTLFPPVRPRGWFEVRYVDAQAEAWWPVPMAVLTALADDPDASAAAGEACGGLDDWAAAARDGYAVPGLHAAARACFAAALAALRRRGEDPELVGLVAAFAERYVNPGRCPADDPIPEVS